MPTKTNERVDVVVVGAGQAGLGAVYYLKSAGLDTVVLERDRVGETWRSQRWDSFVLNTPNWMNGLPGSPYLGSDRQGFMSASELVSSFESYVERFDLPVRMGMNVTSVAESDGLRRFRVDYETKSGSNLTIEADHVVVASGILRSPRIPAIGSKVSANVLQLTAGSYRSPDELPPGGVVVVGGGQSGAQIVEDLLGSDRSIYFSISKAARVPRRYRGRDFMDWWVDMGLWEVRGEDVDDPAVLSATNPLVSGVGMLGHSLSYQHLANSGARLMGRLQDVDNEKLITDDRVLEYIHHADDFSQMQKDRIDEFIVSNDIDAEDAAVDVGDVPLRVGESVEFVTELDLELAEIGTVIWSTGFTGDFHWIGLPAIDDGGQPMHQNGVSPVAGLYFIGFPWISTRKSGVVFGIDDDARHISDHILAGLNWRAHPGVGSDRI